MPTFVLSITATTQVSSLSVSEATVTDTSGAAEGQILPCCYCCRHDEVSIALVLLTNSPWDFSIAFWINTGSSKTSIFMILNVLLSKIHF